MVEIGNHISVEGNLNEEKYRWTSVSSPVRKKCTEQRLIQICSDNTPTTEIQHHYPVYAETAEEVLKEFQKEFIDSEQADAVISDLCYRDVIPSLAILKLLLIVIVQRVSFSR